MRRTRLNFPAAAAGFALMLVALASSSVTLASGDYRGALLTAMTCTMLSLACLAVPFVRGPVAWRVAAVILACPALFVFADFIRRAPFVFGGSAGSHEHAWAGPGRGSATMRCAPNAPNTSSKGDRTL